jgi:hypothetical protein
MNTVKNIELKISQLPPSLVIKLDDYLNYLLSQRNGYKESKILRQSWAGGLKEFKKEYSSIELQKLALEWRTE